MAIATEAEAEPKTTIRSVLSDPSVRTVILVAFIVMIGVGAALPILPLYARSFGVSYAAAGLFTSAFGLARLVADLGAGSLVDRVGERRAATGGLALLAVFSFLAGLAPTFGLAVFFWAIGGMGSAVLFAAQFSYLLKAVPPPQMARTLGVFYGAFNAGIIIGGMVGGFIAGMLGLAAPLFVYAALLVIATFVYARLVPDPPQRHPGPEAGTVESVVDDGDTPLLLRGAAAVRSMLGTRGFKMVIFVNFAYMWMVSGTFDTLLPLFAKEQLGMSTVGVGTAFAVWIAAEFLVLYPAGGWADRFGRKPVMVPSLAALALVSAVVGFAESPSVLFVLMIALGLASGTSGVPPMAMLSDVVPEEKSGTAVGIFRFAGDLSFFVGPLVIGITTNAFGFRTAFPLAAIPALIALILVVRTPETLKLREARQPAAV